MRVIEVVPEEELPPVPEAPRPSPQARRRRVLIALGGVVLALAAAVAGMVLARGNNARPFAVAANSVAVIDPETNAVVGAIQVGDSPGPIAASRDSLWVVNRNDRTLMKINSADRSVMASVGLPR